MNSTLKMVLIASAVFIIGTTLLIGGMVILHSGYWMMNGFGWHAFPAMMGYGNGMMGRGLSSGMMGGGYSNGNFRGMMGQFTDQIPANIETLTIVETEAAVEAYLTAYGDNDLILREIMIFENNAYALIAEESTGMGAFELLVDPVSKVAYPEHGANMMWNAKYGTRGNGGMMGGMMGGLSQNTGEMKITSKEALTAAGKYLASVGNGETVSDEITAFYGYYTIDTLKNGELYGMLSVNGYDGSVIYHSWHAGFIEMSEEE